MSLYGMSKETDIIDEFWSHSWHSTLEEGSVLVVPLWFASAGWFQSCECYQDSIGNLENSRSIIGLVEGWNLWNHRCPTVLLSDRDFVSKRLWDQIMEFGRLELQLWACEIHIFGFGHFGPLGSGFTQKGNLSIIDLRRWLLLVVGVCWVVNRQICVVMLSMRLLWL